MKSDVLHTGRCNFLVRLQRKLEIDHLELKGLHGFHKELGFSCAMWDHYLFIIAFKRVHYIKLHVVRGRSVPRVFLCSPL